ncbi:DUF262 domain-containing protein [Ponticaulis profundi]|uniref:DUF262 domain-containing protein n=1 Tax=Ponticaulis profundi TaxID=2665222 RepID=A0ABW1S990_9PROT
MSETLNLFSSLDESSRDEAFEDLAQSESSDDFDVSTEDFSNLFIIPSDWSISVVKEYLGDRIELDPSFQRRGVWSKQAKSKFIESIFLGIPIPQILLAEFNGSDFIVLDGKQRLLAIKEFIDGKFDDGSPFVLRGLEILKTINDQNWSSIKKNPKLARSFENSTIRFAQIRGWQKEAVLYEIFYRLNSGSVKLSPMELRMALIRGDFLRAVITWTESPGPLHLLLNLKQPDKRMNDVELAVRFLAFQDRRIEYRGNLKEFLDDYCKIQNVKFEVKSVSDRLNEMNKAISTVISIMGARGACRKWLPNERKFDRRFNRAIFDVVIGSLADQRVREWALQNESAFLSCYQRCFDNLTFVSSVETTTKSIGATRDRFEIWLNELEKASSIKLEMPNIAERPE